MNETSYQKVRKREKGLFSPRLAEASILVVDDEAGIRNFLVKTIGEHCRKIEEASCTKEATIKLDAARYDVVILDNVMQGQTGIDWLAEQRQIGFFGEAILITAFADLETVIEALRAGAVDFLLKPFRSNQILSAISNCLDRAALRKENALLRHELGTGGNLLTSRQELIGNSEEITKVKEYIKKAARLDSSVLIKGETGTGKEVAARMLHFSSHRAGRAFVPVTCAAFADKGFSEILFGSLPEAYEPGQQSDGLLLAADGGTLFLDNVDELSNLAQAALMHVMETGCIRPINATREVPIDLRFITSTSKSLLDLVKLGLFREDLYYRLNVLSIEMPPLRDRPVDIIELSTLFIEKLAPELNVSPPEITPSVRRRLITHKWPGNVRELRNHLERGLISDDLEIGLDYDVDDAYSENETNTLAAVERRHILETLNACGGNRAETARRLKVSRKTIDRKCQSWDLYP